MFIRKIKNGICFAALSNLILAQLACGGALEDLEASAKNGFVDSQERLGDYYRNGYDSTKEDPKKHLKNVFGWTVTEEIKVEKNTRLALQWYLEASCSLAPEPFEKYVFTHALANLAGNDYFGAYLGALESANRRFPKSELRLFVQKFKSFGEKEKSKAMCDLWEKYKESKFASTIEFLDKAKKFYLLSERAAAAKKLNAPMGTQEEFDSFLRLPLDLYGDFGTVYRYSLGSSKMYMIVAEVLDGGVVAHVYHAKVDESYYTVPIYAPDQVYEVDIDSLSSDDLRNLNLDLSLEREITDIANSRKATVTIPGRMIGKETYKSSRPKTYADYSIDWRSRPTKAVFIETTESYINGDALFPGYYMFLGMSDLEDTLGAPSSDKRMMNALKRINTDELCEGLYFYKETLPEDYFNSPADAPRIKLPSSIKSEF